MIPKISLDIVQDTLERKNVDVLVASSPPNVFYISDLPCMCTSQNRLLFTVFQANPAYCIFTSDGEAKLILTNSALELAGRSSWIKDLVTYKTGTYIVRPDGISTENQTVSTDALISTLRESKPKTLAIEVSGINCKLYHRIRKSFRGSRILDAAPLFRELRMIKTTEEIRRFREATRILCTATLKVVDSIEEGITEIELDNILKATILSEGGDSWHQTTIAAGPENGPNIFNQATSRKIAGADIIRLDIGCLYRGYTADNARTVAVKPISQESERIYRAVKESTDAAINAIKPGLKACEVYQMIVKEVRQRCDPLYTRGNVGHGVGVELYEAPEITIENKQDLLPGMTISIEAPYHKLGLGGFIVEDSILVTDNGCEDLTTMSRDLFVV